MNHFNREKEEANTEDIKAKQERTILVKEYGDKNIRNSGDVRKQVNKEFPGAKIRNARTTAGCSILLEFDDSVTANTVAGSWKNTLFGGNKGIMRGNKPRNAGIIKFVNLDRTEDEIEEEITSKYENSEVEFFKKNKKSTGMIKVKFDSGDQLEDALVNRVKIFEQRYIMEKFIFKPRVIMCLKCQRYGHIERVCRSEKSVCGNCKNNNHKTEHCTVEEQQHKCYHCDGNHHTGHKSCLVHQAKEDVIRNRFQYA